MLVTHALQPETSLVPVLQSECEQLPPPPPPLEVQVPLALQVWPLAQLPQVPPQPSEPQVLPLQLGVQPPPPPPPPVHDWPHTELTSPTQIESHAVAQQYESAAQILVAHGSQPEVSLPPDEQIGCEQVPPPPPPLETQVPLALQVEPVAQVPQLPPQPSEPQVLPLQLGVQPPPPPPPPPDAPASDAPLGVPTPVGPS